MSMKLRLCLEKMNYFYVVQYWHFVGNLRACLNFNFLQQKKTISKIKKQLCNTHHLRHKRPLKTSRNPYKTNLPAIYQKNHDSKKNVKKAINNHSNHRTASNIFHDSFLELIFATREMFPKHHHPMSDWRQRFPTRRAFSF